MIRWWENETPQTIETDKNVMRYYPQAEKLQVSRPNWTDDYGESKPGKTVVLDLSESGVMDFLRNITKTE